MAAMNNTACQSCHQARYVSFATDHPDFGNWPYVRRSRIAFNHATHRAKHFAEKKQAFDCRACHVEDATHSVQLTASYVTSCASCHDEKIAASVANGMPMFALPTLPTPGVWAEVANSAHAGGRTVRRGRVKVATHSLVLLGFAEIT